MFVAEGRGGFRVYDVASIGNKGVSDRILTAPFSPLGNDTHVASGNATCMALPTNQPIAPTRNTERMRTENLEQAFHPIYHYAVITDAEEGLILVNVDTLADGSILSTEVPNEAATPNGFALLGLAPALVDHMDRQQWQLIVGQHDFQLASLDLPGNLV